MLAHPKLQLAGNPFCNTQLTVHGLKVPNCCTSWGSQWPTSSHGILIQAESHFCHAYSLSARLYRTSTHGGVTWHSCTQLQFTDSVLEGSMEVHVPYGYNLKEALHASPTCISRASAAISHIMTSQQAAL